MSLRSELPHRQGTSRPEYSRCSAAELQHVMRAGRIRTCDLRVRSNSCLRHWRMPTLQSGNTRQERASGRTFFRCLLFRGYAPAAKGSSLPGRAPTLRCTRSWKEVSPAFRHRLNYGQGTNDCGRRIRTALCPIEVSAIFALTEASTLKWHESARAANGLRLGR